MYSQYLSVALGDINKNFRFPLNIRSENRMHGAKFMEIYLFEFLSRQMFCYALFFFSFSLNGCGNKSQRVDHHSANMIFGCVDCRLCKSMNILYSENICSSFSFRLWFVSLSVCIIFCRCSLYETFVQLE